MKKLFTYIAITLSVAFLLIPYPIYAQTSNFQSVCSLAGNIKIDYPADSWIAKKDFKDTGILLLEHNSGKATFRIHSQYYSGLGENVLPNPSEAANNIFQQYSTKQDFQLYSKIGDTPTGDYYIETQKFVHTNPTYLLGFRYTEPNIGSFNVFITSITIGDNLYLLEFISTPEITAELWPIIEQMLPSFWGSFGTGDPVIDLDANGNPFMCK